MNFELLQVRLHSFIYELKSKIYSYLAPHHFLIHFDSLTGAYNRRSFSLFANRILRKNGSPSPIIALINTDNMKSMNDKLRSLKRGDDYLVTVVNHIRNKVGFSGLVCRFGGDEIVILFISRTNEEVFNFMEDIRLDIQDISLVSDDGNSVSCTISSGICYAQKDLFSMLKIAEEWAYEAKEKGRNQTLPKPDKAKNGLIGINP